MGFDWKEMFNETSKQVRDGFDEIKKQVNQIVDSEFPEFPKNNRSWACKCGEIVDSKYEFCPKCGISKKEMINSFLEKQSICELETSRKIAKELSEKNVLMMQKISLLSGQCSDLQNSLDITKNKLKNMQLEYNNLNDKYLQLKREFDTINKTKNTSFGTDYTSDGDFNKSNKTHTNEYKNISYNGFLHKVYDDYNTSIENEAESVNCFNIALEYKRAGRFSEAIDMQVKSIRYYLFDPDLKGNFYSMAKTYYLMHRYDDSLNCYRIYLQLCVLQGNKKLSFNLLKNMGHAIYDERNKNEKKIEIAYYRSALVGNPLNNEQYRLMSDEYDKSLAKHIAFAASLDIEKMDLRINKTLSEIKTMMLHYTRFRNMNS